MTTRSTVYGAFTVARTYPHPPSRVFRAFADEQAKAKWFGAGSFIIHERAFDFSVGGQEVLVGNGGGTVSAFHSVYHDIIQDERIVHAYRMALNGVPISVSLATIELKPHGAGTILTVTEHGVFLDGYEDNGSREHGTGWLMDRLGESLETEAV